MTIALPCALPLVALRAHETCPRCGHPAGRHRAHPSYQEETMTETTEPTRGWIEKCIAELESALLCSENSAIAHQWQRDLAVYRMALRTLDAEAQLAERDRYIAEQRAITEPSVQDLARQIREATARAEKAERERDEEGRLRTEWGALYTDMVRQRDDWHEAANAADERAEVSRELHEAAERDRDRDEARAKLAEAERELAAAENCAEERRERAKRAERYRDEARAKITAIHRRAHRNHPSFVEVPRV